MDWDDTAFAAVINAVPLHCSGVELWIGGL
jgi:hypothetical protein